MIFERPPAGERVLCVLPTAAGSPRDEDELEAESGELAELVNSLGLETIDTLVLKVRQIRRSSYLGAGQIALVRERRLAHAANLVVIAVDISAAQQRNLEEDLGCKVLTRTETILMVFSERARSHEGMLQVELAELQHSATRVVSGWSHLDRQKGGIGLRGAGETQAEADRRQIAVRIRKLRLELKKVVRRRAAGRRQRVRAGVATVALVGYTNSGKSTLFNRLTGAAVSTRDRSFETLDPTLRRVALPGREDAVLIDTVGFVRELPASLVAAFRATLEEAIQADLLLLVADMQARDRIQRRESVLKMLRDIGAEDIPRLEVANKMDLAETGSSALHGGFRGTGSDILPVSALRGTGMDALRHAMTNALGTGKVYHLSITPQAAGTRSQLYDLGAVIDESTHVDGTVELGVRLTPARLNAFLKTSGVALTRQRSRSG